MKCLFFQTLFCLGMLSHSLRSLKDGHYSQRGVLQSHNKGLIESAKSLDRVAVIKTLSTMTVISAPLGVSLDNYHGLFNVLNYHDISVPIIINYFDKPVLKTAIFVPFLFGLAGLAMSSIILVGDELFGTEPTTRNSSWSNSFYTVSLFSFQYYLSGYLDFSHADILTINIILAIFASVGWFKYDGSTAGAVLSILTAVAGPVVEILLINEFDLYSYTNADFMGICFWIVWVYALGGPAVGNLARSFYSYYKNYSTKT